MRRFLPPVTGSTPLLGMISPNYRLFLLGASSVLLLAIWLFFTKTRAGVVVRAAVQDAEMLERGVVSLWPCLLFAVLVVGLYALVVSYFSTARRGIYFALLTLIFAEVVYTFFRYTQTFGGSDGIQGLPAPSLAPGFAIDTPLRNYYL